MSISTDVHDQGIFICFFTFILMLRMQNRYTYLCQYQMHSFWNSSWALFDKQSLYVYTVLRFCSTPSFPIFNLSEFEREPLKLGKQMIPHFVALVVGSKICQVQLFSSIRGCHATFLLKDPLFKGEVTWQSHIEQKSCSPNTSEPLLRAFKLGVTCFSTIILSCVCGYIQKCPFLLNEINIKSYLLQSSLFTGPKFKIHGMWKVFMILTFFAVRNVFSDQKKRFCSKIMLCKCMKNQRIYFKTPLIQGFFYIFLHSRLLGLKMA